MVLALGRKVGGAGFFWSKEVTQEDSIAVHVNVCTPLVGDIVLGLAFGNANDSGAVVCSGSPLILAIAAPTYITQVADPVVVPDAVDMVNVVNRPSTINVQPSKAMGFVTAIVNVDLHVSAIGKVASSAASNSHATAHTPRKNPGLGAVVETFAQEFCGKIGISHAVVLLKRWFGERPSSVSALSGLHHFNMGGA
jgi:Flp pilus assembly protein TadG